MIIELFRKRDEQAIAELKKKYQNLCMHVAGNILSRPEDVEECVNSAYFDIWNNIPPETPNDLKTYLCRIVKNKAIDRLKYNSAEKRNAQLTVSLDELAECIPDRTDEELSAARRDDKQISPHAGRKTQKDFREALLVRRLDRENRGAIRNERKNGRNISFPDKGKTKSLFAERRF